MICILYLPIIPELPPNQENEQSVLTWVLTRHPYPEGHPRLPKVTKVPSRSFLSPSLPDFPTTLIFASSLVSVPYHITPKYVFPWRDHSEPLEMEIYPCYFPCLKSSGFSSPLHRYNLILSIQAEKERATRSSVLAWRIPWTEELDGLWSIGLQQVRNNWSDLAHTSYVGLTYLVQKYLLKAFCMWGTAWQTGGPMVM